MRYKEFNSNKVLEDCIPLFWSRGFGACSIKDIVEATGVNRFSLYEEFKNKNGLLEESLDLYSKRYSFKNMELLNSEKSLDGVLTSFYMSFMEDVESHPPGCFIIHIATELADSNKQVKEFLNTYLKDLEARFVLLIEQRAYTSEQAQFYAKHLIGLYCTSMCFCVIHSYDERKSIISNGINLILKRNKNYVSNTL